MRYGRKLVSAKAGTRSSTFRHRRSCANERKRRVLNIIKRPIIDRSKIEMDKPLSVKRWTKALGVPQDELQQAVDKVGNSAAAVRKQLGLLGSAHP